MNTKTLLSFALAASALLSGAAARAHDLVLMPAADGELRIRFGHPKDWLSVDAEKLLEVQTIDTAGKVTDRHGALTRRDLEMVLPLTTDAALLIAARYDNGLWLTLPGTDGQPVQYRNASKFMLPEGTDPMLAVKYAKGIVLRADDETLFGETLGHRLEIIPQKNPLKLGEGDALPVLVRFNGRPLAGAEVENSDLETKLPEDQIVRYQTNADGIAQVKLRRGVNVLAIDHTVPNDGSLGDAARALPVDKGALIATYAFQL